MSGVNRVSIMVTGAAGYIGSGLCEFLQSNGRDVIAVSRSTEQQSSFLAVDLAREAVPDSYLKKTRVIVHCAGRAHKPKDPRSGNTEIHHFRDNCDAAERLARDAARCGVQRFVLLSSVGVNGTSNLRPFTEEDAAHPGDAYSASKYKAERALLKIQEQTGMEIVIVRPPLVYGPNAPGNFGKLVKALESGIPLPLGAVSNQRSFVGLGNLVDFLSVCIDHPAAANQVFLVSDGNDLSTTDFLRSAAKGLGKSARLLPIPAWLLKTSLVLIGRRDMAISLLDSLRIDITKARQLLGWEPPMSVDEGLDKTVGSLQSADGRR